MTDDLGDDDPCDVTCPGCSARVESTWAAAAASCGGCGLVWHPTLYDVMFDAKAQDLHRRMGWVDE